MRSNPTTPFAIAATLAAAIAERHALIDIKSPGTLSPAALQAATALVTVLEDAIAARPRLFPAHATSLVDKLASAQAEAAWGDELRDTLVPLIAALEDAGVTLDLLPGLVAADPFADPEPALAGRPAGIELHLRPLPLGHAA